MVPVENVHANGWVSGLTGPLARFLRSHPVVCLLLLTPGIPEYLSSSSPINAIVLNPPLFFFELAANLGLYGPGVLLIYEAKVRWNKGWASVLLLGAAYGILEEGVALSTLFNPNASPVSSLGQYGHWLGVNWIWVASILPVHMIYSISLPMVLLGLALPRTVGRSLLSKRQIAVAFATLVVDVLALMLIVVRSSGYWMGWGLLVSSLVAIGVLVWTAHRIPAGVLHAATDLPQATNRRMAAVGIVFFPAVLLTQSLGKGTGLPAPADFVLVVVIQALFMVYIVRKVGAQGNERRLLSLSLGLILSIATIGVVAESTLPLTLLADLAMVLFFRKLWGRYGSPVTKRDREGPELSSALTLLYQTTLDNPEAP